LFARCENFENGKIYFFRLSAPSSVHEHSAERGPMELFWLKTCRKVCVSARSVGG
jgi:hypothetical protein